MTIAVRRFGLALAMTLTVVSACGPGRSEVTTQGEFAANYRPVAIAGGGSEFLILERSDTGATTVAVATVQKDAAVEPGERIALSDVPVADPTITQMSDGRWVVLGVECKDLEDHQYTPACDPGTVKMAVLSPGDTSLTMLKVPEEFRAVSIGLRGASSESVPMEARSNKGSVFWLATPGSNEFVRLPINAPLEPLKQSIAPDGSARYPARTACLTEKGPLIVDGDPIPSGAPVSTARQYDMTGNLIEESTLVDGSRHIIQDFLHCPLDGPAQLVAVDHDLGTAIAIPVDSPEDGEPAWEQRAGVRVGYVNYGPRAVVAQAVDTRSLGAAPPVTSEAGSREPAETTSTDAQVSSGEGIRTVSVCLCGGSWYQLGVGAVLGDQVQVLADRSAALVLRQSGQLEGWVE